MQKGASLMQKSTTGGKAVRHFPITLDPGFPVNVPYLQRLHYPVTYPKDYMHYHDSTEIGICHQGTGIFYIGNHIYPFSEGDVTIIPPGIVHIAQSDRENISGWQFIDVDFPRILAAQSMDTLIPQMEHFSGVLHRHEHEHVWQWVNRIIRELQRADPYAQQAVFQLLGLVGIALARMEHEKPLENKLAGSMQAISPAIIYISRYYDQAVTADQLAALCNRSVTAFRRAFFQATGMTPFAYLYQVRIQTAVNLLRNSSMSVSEIAERVGYQTLSSFHRHFKQILGYAPNTVRHKPSHHQGERP